MFGEKRKRVYLRMEENIQIKKVEKSVNSTQNKKKSSITFAPMKFYRFIENM